MTNDETQGASGEDRAKLLSRSDVLRRAGALGLSVGLGSAFAPSAFASAEATQDIKMLTWQGYDVQKVMKPFQKAHDLSFHATFIGNHDDIQAKVTQDPSGYNLITYYEGYHDLYKQLDILSPIDPSKVPNLKNNYSQFKNKLWWNSDGKLWGVPWTWGSWTLNYNPAKMAAPTKWTDLLAPKFKGKIAILDDPNGAIVIGARILKLPIPNLTSKQLDSVIDLWRKFRANARTISPSPGDLVNLFASGEIVAVAPGYIAVTGLAAAQKVKLSQIIPSEGAALLRRCLGHPAQGARSRRRARVDQPDAHPEGAGLPVREPAAGRRPAVGAPGAQSRLAQALPLHEPRQVVQERAAVRPSEQQAGHRPLQRVAEQVGGVQGKLTRRAPNRRTPPL